MKTNRWIILFIGALIIAGFLSLMASNAPDGLEKVAEDHGFIESALEYPFQTIMPNYAFTGVLDGQLSAVLVGVVGVVLTFGLMMLVGKIVILNIWIWQKIKN